MRRWLYVLAAVGAVAAVSASAQTYTYDDLGRLKTVTAPSGAVSSYCYDADNNRTVVQKGGVNSCAVNHVPTCTPYIIYPSSPDSSVNPYTWTFQSTGLLNHCSDPDGDTLTIVSPSAPYTVQSWWGQPAQLTYTVSDGKGGLATGYATVLRD